MEFYFIFYDAISIFGLSVIGGGGDQFSREGMRSKHILEIKPH